MKIHPWTQALAGLLLVAGVQPIEASPTGDTVQEIRESFKAAKRDKSLTVESSLGWIEQLYVLAGEGAGADEGYDALMAILEIERGRKSKEVSAAAERAPGMLIDGYADDLEKMGDFIDRTSPDEGQLDDIRKATTNPRVAATCFVADLNAAMEGASYGKMSEEKVIRGMGACEELMSPKFADLENAAGVAFREAIAGNYFQLTRLRIGMVAPDIVANDLDGVEFKLSDYRGKVVVLDFWGNW